VKYTPAYVLLLMRTLNRMVPDDPVVERARVAAPEFLRWRAIPPCPPAGATLMTGDPDVTDHPEAHPVPPVRPEREVLAE
jgi:hypothetical protein